MGFGDVDSEGPTKAGGVKRKSKAYAGHIQRSDWLAIGVLTFLYFLQGLPMGLVQGTLPLLLRAGGSASSFTQLGLFSMVLYPYSLKLLWSPIVDSVWSKHLGRRKSWIVPTQLLAGLLLIFAASAIQLNAPASAPSSNSSQSSPTAQQASSWLTLSFAGPMSPEQQWLAVAKLTCLFFVVVLLVATQDIALDGWALTILPKRIVSYGSTCQTVGLQVGGFFSFTLLLALNSPAFCNAFLRTEPNLAEGVLTVNGFIATTGWLFIVASVLLVAFPIAEPPPRGRLPSTASTYLYIANVFAKPAVCKLAAVLLLSKLGFVVTDSVTNLKFLEAGLSVEYLGLIAALDFPFQVLSAIWIGWMSSHSEPLRTAEASPQPSFNSSLSSWCFGFLLKIVVGLFGCALVLVFQQVHSGSSFLLFGGALFFQVFNSFASTAMFVSMGAFFARVCDSSTGGTFITLLQTINNLGNMWPKFIVLSLVDLLTASACVEQPIAPGLQPVSLFNACHHPREDSLCIPELNRSCMITSDGYFPTVAISLSLAFLLYFGFLRHRLAELSALAGDATAWQPACSSSALDV